MTVRRSLTAHQAAKPQERLTMASLDKQSDPLRSATDLDVDAEASRSTSTEVRSRALNDGVSVTVIALLISTVFCGFAAGCAVRLRLTVRVLIVFSRRGLASRRFRKKSLTGKAEPFRTSGGRAASEHCPSTLHFKLRYRLFIKLNAMAGRT